jgi:hypothetical protein
MCESEGQAWGYIVPVLALAAWGTIVFVIFRGAASEDRPWLAALLFGCMAIGIMLLIGAEGLDDDGDHLGRFFISLGVAAALGLAVGLARKRATLRSVAAALAGDVFLPGLLLLFIIWLFVGTGFCLS